MSTPVENGTPLRLPRLGIEVSTWTRIAPRSWRRRRGVAHAVSSGRHFRGRPVPCSWRTVARCWPLSAVGVYWLSDPLALRFRPGYYSESTSGLTWLLAWWLLRRWRESLKRVSLLAGARSRDHSRRSRSLPLAVYLLKPLVRTRAWKDVIAAGVAGAGVVGILGVANYSVTKNPFTTAFAFYAEQYLPVDKLGFKLDSTPPRFRLAAQALLLTKKSEACMLVMSGACRASPVSN